MAAQLGRAQRGLRALQLGCPGLGLRPGHALPDVHPPMRRGLTSILVWRDLGDRVRTEIPELGTDDPRPGGLFVTLVWCWC